jgi:hypothetical protein
MGHCLLFPKSFTPCTGWEGGLFATISVRSGTTFHISQWVKLPTGASGSSTINTRLLASLSTPSIFNVGLMSLPSQVKRSGMFRRFPTHDTIVWPNDHGPKPSRDACGSSSSVRESRPNRGGEDGQESR